MLGALGKSGQWADAFHFFNVAKRKLSVEPGAAAEKPMDVPTAHRLGTASRVSDINALDTSTLDLNFLHIRKYVKETTSAAGLP